MRVVIIGLPNVGKSTLFNKLVGRKKALVHREAGMTRDVVCDVAEWTGKRFEVLDTGGIFENPAQHLNEKITRKALEYAEKADLILFVLDGKREILPWEEELAKKLRRLNKPVFVVVNKKDNPVDRDVSHFEKLGFKNIFPVSAEHNHGLSELLDAIVGRIKGKGVKGFEEAIKLLILGRPNVGKSTFVNRLLGEERIIVDERPGTTRDVIDVVIKRKGIYFRLLDTAGMRKLSRATDCLEAAGIVKARKSIRRADVVILMMDASEGPTHHDADIAQQVSDAKKPLVLVVNKWDLVKGDTLTYFKTREKFLEKLHFVSYAPIIFISALTGRRVVNVIDEAYEVYIEGGFQIPTSQLNRYLLPIFESFPPRCEDGKELKIKYVVQTGKRPPVITLFGNRIAKLESNYEKFIIRKIREKWPFKGNPILIRLRRK